MDDLTLYLALIVTFGAVFCIFGVVSEVVEWVSNRRRSHVKVARRLHEIKGVWK